MMTRKPLGRTGLLVPPIGLGCGPFGIVNQANGWDPWSTQGRRAAMETVHTCLDHGVNYIDTAPAYGAGNAEEIVGQVMAGRRQECVLATKVNADLGFAGTMESVHASLRRLQTEYIDIVHVHGRLAGVLEAQGRSELFNPQTLDALMELRLQKKIGFIGLTCEEAWVLIPYLSNSGIDMYQIGYNFINQSASLHFLVHAARAGAGVVTMRTLTSGIMPMILEHLAPQWKDVADPSEVSLKFVLSDSRIHSGLIGMRWAHEVEKNTRLLKEWTPGFDMADLPRLTADVYRRQDSDLTQAVAKIY